MRYVKTKKKLDCYLGNLKLSCIEQPTIYESNDLDGKKLLIQTFMEEPEFVLWGVMSFNIKKRQYN